MTEFHEENAEEDLSLSQKIDSKTGLPCDIALNLRKRSIDKNDVFARFVMELAKEKDGPKKIQNFFERPSHTANSPVLRLRGYEKAVLKRIVYTPEDHQLDRRCLNRKLTLLGTGLLTAACGGAYCLNERQVTNYQKELRKHREELAKKDKEETIKIGRLVKDMFKLEAEQQKKEAKKVIDAINEAERVMAAEKRKVEEIEKRFETADTIGKTLLIAFPLCAAATGVAAVRYGSEKMRDAQIDRDYKWKMAYKDMNAAMVQEKIKIDKGQSKS